MPKRTVKRVVKRKLKARGPQRPKPPPKVTRRRPVPAKAAQKKRYPPGTLTRNGRELDVHDLDEARTLVTMARWSIEHGHSDVAERSLISASKLFEKNLGISRRSDAGSPNSDIVRRYIKYFEDAVVAYMLLSRLQRAREGPGAKRKASDLSRVAMRIRELYQQETA